MEALDYRRLRILLVSIAFIASILYLANLYFTTTRTEYGLYTRSYTYTNESLRVNLTIYNWCSGSKLFKVKVHAINRTPKEIPHPIKAPPLAEYPIIVLGNSNYTMDIEIDKENVERFIVFELWVYGDNGWIYTGIYCYLNIGKD